MRQFLFAAVGLALFASPAAAEHLYSNGQAPHGSQWYAIGPQSSQPQGAPPASAAEAVTPQGYGLTPRWRRTPTTGLDRPYGGQGVPYRTPPQGWPENPM